MGCFNFCFVGARICHFSALDYTCTWSINVYNPCYVLFVAAGLRSIAVAENSIMVDRTPPLAGTVNDGSVISLDASYQSSLDTLCVNWEGFSDPESGVAEIDWTVGDSEITVFIIRFLIIVTTFIFYIHVYASRCSRMRDLPPDCVCVCVSVCLSLCVCACVFQL